MKDIQTLVEIEKGDNDKTLLSKYGCLAFDRQGNLSDLVGDLEGNLDLETGILKFNDDIEFPVQLLGFYRKDDESDEVADPKEELGQWSWCWDNDNIGFDEKLIEDSIKIKEIGEEYGIDIFTAPFFDIYYHHCHSLILTVSGILDLDGYYAASVGNLEVFVGIKSDLIKRDESAEKFRNVYANFQKNFNVFPKLTFECYTKLKGYIDKENDEFSVAKIGEDRLIAGFTDRGNLTHIQMLTVD